MIAFDCHFSFINWAVLTQGKGDIRQVNKTLPRYGAGDVTVLPCCLLLLLLNQSFSCGSTTASAEISDNFRRGRIFLSLARVGFHCNCEQFRWNRGPSYKVRVCKACQVGLLLGKFVPHIQSRESNGGVSRPLSLLDWSKGGRATWFAWPLMV